MTEAELQRSIVHAARELGWRDAWTWKSLHSPKGWPDLVLARRRHLIVAELKSDKGKVTPGQETWLAWWREFAASVNNDLCCFTPAFGVPPEMHVAHAARVDVFVWRPADLDEAYRLLATGRTA